MSTKWCKVGFTLYPSNLPYSAFELLKLKLHFTLKNSLWRTTWCHRSYCYLSNINSQNWVCPQSAHPIPLFQGVRIFSRIYAPVNSNHFLIPAAMAEICSTFRYFIISALSSCLDFHEKRSLSQLRIKVVVPPFKFPSKENVAVKKNYLCRPIILPERTQKVGLRSYRVTRGFLPGNWCDCIQKAVEILPM